MDLSETNESSTINGGTRWDLVLHGSHGRIQDFPERAPTRKGRQPIIWAKFAEKLHEKEEICRNFTM